jgi:hypothetical protein
LFDASISDAPESTALEGAGMGSPTLLHATEVAASAAMQHVRSPIMALCTAICVRSAANGVLPGFGATDWIFAAPA